MENADAQQNGDHRDPHRVNGREAMRDAIADTFARAKRKLLIYAPTLDAGLLNSSQAIDALTSLCAGGPPNHVHVLVEQGDRTVRENGRLTNLARRVSDLVEIRQLGEDTPASAEMFVIVDRNGYLHQPDVDKAQCVIDLDDTTRAGAFSHRFDRMWERSDPIASLRVLGLGR